MYLSALVYLFWLVTCILVLHFCIIIYLFKLSAKNLGENFAWISFCFNDRSKQAAWTPQVFVKPDDYMIQHDLRWSMSHMIKVKKISYLISDLEIVPNLKHTLFIIKQNILF